MAICAMCLKWLNYDSNILSKGFWLSLDEALCGDLFLQHNGHSPTISFCYNPNSGQISFNAFSAVGLPFKTGIPLCSPPVPGLNFTVINSQGTVEIFIGIQLLHLANNTIIMHAQRLSANVSLDSSWVNGHTSFQEENGGTSKRPTGGYWINWIVVFAIECNWKISFK